MVVVVVIVSVKIVVMMIAIIVVIIIVRTLVSGILITIQCATTCVYTFTHAHTWFKECTQRVDLDSEPPHLHLCKAKTILHNHLKRA